MSSSEIETILNEIQDKLKQKVDEENKNCYLRDQPEFKDYFEKLGQFSMNEIGDNKRIVDKLFTAQLRTGWNGVYKYISNTNYNMERNNNYKGNNNRFNKRENNINYK